MKKVIAAIALVGAGALGMLGALYSVMIITDKHVMEYDTRQKG